MQPEHTLAIRALRAEQDRIRRLVRNVDERIDALATEIQQVRPPVVPDPVPVPPPAPSVPARVQPEPRSLPPLAAREIREVAAPPPSPPPEPPAPEPEAPESPRESLEIAFGRVWLVRIGIVILLTGLVFLGNLAYQSFIPRLGPAGKLGLILAAGGGLCGLGAWLERKREDMRNYARVLLAGGCATFYYAAYAAHFVATLRVIENPLLGGALLLALAGGVAWVAHRRRSETIGILAVLLSYYTSGLNPIGTFTLFSCLLLSATTLFFLAYHRWVTMTFISLVGTYVSYAWWRFAGGGTMLAGPLAVQFAFLAGYWLMFSASVFLPKVETVTHTVRAQIAGANNGAFFALGALELLRQDGGSLWQFALGFGVILLALGWVAFRRWPDRRGVAGSYLVQGVLLTTVGLALRLTGPQFAVVLAVQSTTLLLLSGNGQVVRTALAFLSATGAAWLAGNAVAYSSGATIHTGLIVGAILLANAWLHRVRNLRTPHDAFDPSIGYLAGLALLLAGGWTIRQFSSSTAASLLAAASVIGAVLPYVFRFRELTLLVQAFMPIAAGWAVGMTGAGRDTALLLPGLCGVAIVLTVFWERQRRLALSESTRSILPWTHAPAAAATLLAWLLFRCSLEPLMHQVSLIGTLWLAFAMAIRSRALAVVEVPFTVIALVLYTRIQADLSWYSALVPLGHVISLAALTRWMHRLAAPTDSWLDSIRLAIPLAVVGMTVHWTIHHIPAEWQAGFFALMSAGFLIGGSRRRAPEMATIGVLLAALSWALAVMMLSRPAGWQSFASVLLIGATFRWSCRTAPSETKTALSPIFSWATMTGLTILVLRAGSDHGHLAYLTVLWGLLAVGFVIAGFLLRDRTYRQGGLILLSIAAARLFFVDVWNFHAIARIASFLILGVVLLLIGYFYNRFAEQLRRWL